LSALPASRFGKLQRFAELVRAEKERRAAGELPPDVGLSWSRTFAGRPTAFIAELMPDWLTPDWLAWRSFVKVLFGEPLDEPELEVYRRCTALTDPPEGLQRQAWVPVGRRGGKSRVLAFVAVHLGTCYDWTRHLAPGEVGYISVLADQRDHASAIMNYVKACLLDHPRLKTLVSKALVESVELKGSVEIEVVTASIKAVRSRTVIAALLDEIAFWQADETCANPDVEIINALRPAMATIPNAMQLAASSRYARRGALWNAYRDHFGKVGGPLVWSGSTETMHPSIDREFLAEEYARDPVAAAAEYGEEFRSDVAAFVPREVVESLVTPGLVERLPQRGLHYVAFVDPAGGSGTDSMTLAIAHSGGEGSAILDLVREVTPPFSPDSVVTEFSTTLKSYGITRVRGDHYGGEWPRERFRQQQIDYDLCDEPKSAIYQAWLPMINAKRCELLDIARLVHQASTLERRTSRVGKDTIDHAPGGHDDVVNVAAGALIEAAGKQQIVIPAEAMARARMGMRR